VLDLSRLSWTQRQIVLAGDGAQLILAGPGSGKTTVLTARIAYLVASGRVPASSVLALTFARRATRELRVRLGALLGDLAGGLEVATFHAFGLRIIRVWSAELGLGDGPLVIYDAGDAQTALRAAAREIDLDVAGWSATELSALVECCRLGRRAPTSPAWLGQLVQAYEALLRRRHAVDYAGMLALPLQLFRHSARALRVIQDAYRHIACDEFQDLCGAQYALLRLLAAPHRNLVAVGDPCQSLYGWRGADPRLHRAFARDFPEARLHQLTESFRSTAHVVQLANALAAPLTERGPLTTCNAAGPRPRVQVAQDERAEARFVAAEIARLWHAADVAGPAEVAVLYRSNQQATALALALRRQQIPYRVRGGDLFARAAVRVAVAYLRLAHNPADSAALAYIVNTPPRRLGKLVHRLADTPIPPAELPAIAGRLGPAALANAEALVALVQELNSQAVHLRPAALLDFALHRSGYHDWLTQQGEGTAHLGHLAQLRALAAETQDDLGTWLAELQLGDTPDAGVEAIAAVTLSTIHAAKGSEWRVVFVVGLEEGLLPHYRALDARAAPQAAARAGEADAIADELRVAYVAVTRARERLYLTYCRSRRRGTQSEPCAPSRFLSALPVELLGRAA
jgi:DNA helicase-2/ATP-dependent DNA helicase PcrA